ncbi:unnamed protein product [Adineta steineri]|uniref:Uncharacterized protein n=1 Tax=Adineta steineri TaxID=433720 RepID=A0A814VT60_9BILA|nr:unnamed protein product [Adineta steineri]CAF1455114.1 unnamed protein product [Adineta steineri]CAF1568801.1 unnamed protein product [Adineta steineri]
MASNKEQASIGSISSSESPTPSESSVSSEWPSHYEISASSSSESLAPSEYNSNAAAAGGYSADGYSAGGYSAGGYSAGGYNSNDAGAGGYSTDGYNSNAAAGGGYSSNAAGAGGYSTDDYNSNAAAGGGCSTGGYTTDVAGAGGTAGADDVDPDATTSMIEYCIGSNCNAYTYDLNTTALNTYNDQSYQCPNATISGGYCILPLSAAITQCNGDSKCSGYAMTDMLNWHNDLDRSTEYVVQLSTSSTNPSTSSSQLNRWFIYQKTRRKFY